MTAAVLGIDWQTLADAIGLGAIYALMAVGIGLVFGVLRLVNFAYGQLVMAGAYALAFASERGWPSPWASSSASRWFSCFRCSWTGSSSGRCAGKRPP
jgi:branched-subunit amino acid ABC-type transport system permease component